MTTTLNPYLSFGGDTREVMTFYQSVLGGSLDIATYKDFPDMPHEPADDDLVMHAYLHTDDGIQLMAADSPSGVPYTPTAGVALSLAGDDEHELTRQWNALADGGTVTMPLGAAPWGSGQFGMLTDRYGIAWYVTIDAAQS